MIILQEGNPWGDNSSGGISWGDHSPGGISWCENSSGDPFTYIYLYIYTYISVTLLIPYYSSIIIHIMI